MPTRPTIVLPDTAPLIHLAAGHLLDILPMLGRVVVPDVVVLEATRLPGKPWAGEVAAWVSSSGGVEVAETEWGDLYRLAIEQGRKPPRNAGELSIIEWLRADLAGGRRTTLVIFEDKRVPGMLAYENFGDHVTAVKTGALLELAEARGILPSAAAALERIVQRVPTAASTAARRPRP